MSAARMLMQHLRSDNIAYVMRPVATIKHIKQAYDNSITSDIRSIILINCGAVSKCLNVPIAVHKILSYLSCMIILMIIIVASPLGYLSDTAI